MNTIAIDAWFRRCTEEGNWKNYDDLHIDVVYNDPRKNEWVNCGLQLLKMVNDKLDKSIYEATLVIELKDANGIIEYLDYHDLLRFTELGDSPPSVYIFMKDWALWMETLAESKWLQNTVHGDIFLKTKITAGVYGRCVYIV